MQDVVAATDGLAPIHIDDIDPDATKVVRRLLRHGFEAYLVGGCVRDLLLNRTPKDFDVATSATPPEIKKLFRNSRIIGRRFRLAHIFFGPKIIETSTFRAPPAPQPEACSEELMIRRDNVFGTAREDALRRDFTINGLFLDLHQNRVIDHVDGLTDLKARRIRTIGDPRVRIQEDPVRTIRAVKFATRLGFHIDPVTERAMVEFRGLLAKCSVARVLEEIYRLLGSGHAAPALRLMHDMGVLAVLLPELAGALEPPSNLEARALRLPVQDRTGTRVTHTDTEEESRPRDAEPDLSDPGEPTPEELQSFWDQNQQLVDQVVGPDREAAGALTWRYLEQLDRVVPQLTAQPGTTPHALLLAATLTGLTDHQLDPAVPMRDTATIVDLLVTEVCTRLRVSRRDREHVKQILVTQRRMVHRGKRRKPTALLQREYFLEAWHLFRMRCEVTGEYQDDLQRWEGLVGPPSQESSKRRRRPRRRRRRPPPQET